MAIAGANYASPAAGTKKIVAVIGWILTVIPAGMMIMSAAMKLSARPEVVDGFKQFGFPASTITPIGIVELAAALLLLIPQTAVLGAILVAGYLGGAIVTHVRLSQPFLAPLLLGISAWAGLYLRDARLRELIPLRKK